MRGIFALALCAMILGAMAAPHRGTKYYAKSTKEVRATWDEYVSFTAAMLQFIAMNGDMFNPESTDETAVDAVRQILTREFTNIDTHRSWSEIVGFVSQILQYVAENGDIFESTDEVTDEGNTDGSDGESNTGGTGENLEDGSNNEGNTDDGNNVDNGEDDNETGGDAEDNANPGDNVDNTEDNTDTEGQDAIDNNSNNNNNNNNNGGNGGNVDANNDDETNNEDDAVVDAVDVIATLKSRFSDVNVNTRGEWNDYVMFIAGLMNVVAANADIFESEDTPVDETSANAAVRDMFKRAQALDVNTRGEWNDYVNFASQILAYIAQNSDIFEATEETTTDEAVAERGVADLNMVTRGEWTDYVMFISGLMDIVAQNADIFESEPETEAAVTPK